MPEAVLESTFTNIPIRGLADTALYNISTGMKLSLSLEDMRAIQGHYRELDRDPTDVELEVIAQTWSEHCKHRIFGAMIEHTLDGKTEQIDSLFQTYVKRVTEEIQAKKPGFILSAFHDNAGFIKLDADKAVCLKVETHNHPSAIEPYAGANTGIGGVIRDILGAGKGAKPIASIDVFCFGAPDTPADAVKGDTIHPLGILRGVVRGVRDYGNRMGIPTVSGAITFHPDYIYNPLVYVGTAGVIPIKDIPKKVGTGEKIVAVGGRTGRDGLHGATFSSASLDTESHESDMGAVQIGNPIEEKKVSDFVLHARDEGLIEFITDCGAGGFSSAAGEMISDSGGEIYLERAPLKEPGLTSWEIFLSESQERMVLSVKPENWGRIKELAEIYETEVTDIGTVSDSKVLRVIHNGITVCELDGAFLHIAPRKSFSSCHTTRTVPTEEAGRNCDYGEDLKKLLGQFNLTSREPIIREYDHEVQGNTIIKPLAGAGGDCPQDGSVINIDGSTGYVAIGLSLLPQYGELDPYRMGLSSIDETMRQLVVAGADPDRVGLLDNFCMGNPDAPEELGQLVECAKGMAAAARGFAAPFVSGKDSFYNYFETEAGPISIPVTLLASGIGIIDDAATITGASIRGPGNRIGLLGLTKGETGGSAYALMHGQEGTAVPGLDAAAALTLYRKYHQAVKAGWILSAHDLSEGGLAVALAEMGFSLQAGLDIDLDAVPAEAGLQPNTLLFAESNSRILFEFPAEHEAALTQHFAAVPFAVIGSTTGGPARLGVTSNDSYLIDQALAELKTQWKSGLLPYY